jgi:transcriptional regulatory protein AMDR
VQPLSSTDFESCGSNVEINYVVKNTQLCVLISNIVKERFGLRVSQENRRRALERGDESLAKWCRALPEQLQLHSSNFNVWSRSLHLTYNNLLILLHRPRPRASQGSHDHGPNDSDICSSGASTIISTFEELRQKDCAKCWYEGP